MSKPLCLVLQLSGLGFFLTGLGKAAGGNLTGIIIGLILIAIGGIGFRNRLKGDSRPKRKQENNWIK